MNTKKPYKLLFGRKEISFPEEGSLIEQIYEDIEKEVRRVASKLQQKAESSALAKVAKQHSFNFEMKTPAELIELIKEDISIEEDEVRDTVVVTLKVLEKRKMKMYSKALEGFCKNVMFESMGYFLPK